MHNKIVVPELAVTLICICCPSAVCYYKITTFSHKKYKYNITSYSIKLKNQVNYHIFDIL